MTKKKKKSKPRLAVKRTTKAKPVKSGIDPLAKKSRDDFRSAPGYLHADDTPERLASVAELSDGQSVPSGTDETEAETRLVRVATEQYKEFAGHEKRDSKELANTLIELHTLLSAPHTGRFNEHLKAIGIPRTNGYRLMRLHGWKSDRKKDPPPIKDVAKEVALMRSKLCSDAIGYFAQYKGDEFKREWDKFAAHVAEMLGVPVGGK